MRRKLFRNIVFVLFLSATLLPIFNAFAQRKNKNKKNETKVESNIVVSEENRRKAEMYHAEAEKYFILDDMPKAFVL